jgi:branched-subunit amino acid transport protein
MAIALTIIGVALVLAVAMPLGLYVRSKPRLASTWARYTAFVYLACAAFWLASAVHDVYSGKSFVFHVLIAAIFAFCGIYTFVKNRRGRSTR